MSLNFKVHESYMNKEGFYLLFFKSGTKVLTDSKNLTGLKEVIISICFKYTQIFIYIIIFQAIISLIFLCSIIGSLFTFCYQKELLHKIFKLIYSLLIIPVLIGFLIIFSYFAPICMLTNFMQKINELSILFSVLLIVQIVFASLALIDILIGFAFYCKNNCISHYNKFMNILFIKSLICFLIPIYWICLFFGACFVFIIVFFIYIYKHRLTIGRFIRLLLKIEHQHSADDQISIISASSFDPIDRSRTSSILTVELTRNQRSRHTDNLSTQGFSNEGLVLHEEVNGPSGSYGSSAHSLRGSSNVSHQPQIHQSPNTSFQESTLGISRGQMVNAVDNDSRNALIN